MRLQKFIFNLVDPLQASFIPGRHTTDNILIAQEMVHSLQASKSGKGGMLVKLDLKKTYDKVDWQFLLDIYSSVISLSGDYYSAHIYLHIYYFSGSSLEW